MSDQLRHYAETAFVFDRDRTNAQGEPRSYGKPHGFWVSAAGEDDWPSWCKSEEFALDRLEIEYEVVLSPLANVLRVSTAWGIHDFHHEFSVETDFERRYPTSRNFSWPIDWQTVAEKFDGIVIAPYLWSERLGGPSWYYGWDCASGCIWNLNAIASVSELVAVSS